MKNRNSPHTSNKLMLVALALVVSLGFWACSNALLGNNQPVTEGVPVSVTWSGGGLASARGLHDVAVSSVVVLVYSSATGERLAAQASLADSGSDWRGTITVAAGSAVFEANALNASGVVLYVGRATYVVPGAGGSVTITAGTAGIKAGAIQGYAPALSTYVNTFAGDSATAGTGTTDGLIGVAALFTNPYGMTSDGTNIFLADMGSNNIRKIVIATQSVSTFAGQRTGGADSTDAVGVGAAFTSPRGITTDGTNLFIADYGANTIRQIVIGTATVSHLAGTDGLVSGFTDGTGNAATFHSPSGITYYNGNLYVADTANNRIRKVEVSTKIVTTLAGQPDVDGPVNAGSTDGTNVNAKFNGPQGITTDGTYVYVADTANNKIRRILIADGTTLTIAGTGVAGTDNGAGNVAKFNLPIGITIDGTNLFVTDSATHTVRKITGAAGASTAADTTVSTLAGTASTGGTVAGLGTAAQFNGPSGITTDGTNLYVSDYTSHTIRKIQ